jgi:hypothetical protein
MQLTTFFTNGSKQITNLSRNFFLNDNRKKNNVLSPLEIEQKAKSVAQDISGEHYYNHYLEYNRFDIISE